MTYFVMCVVGGGCCVNKIVEVLIIYEGIPNVKLLVQIFFNKIDFRLSLKFQLEINNE
jgi:hypothetical protein